MKRVEYTQFLTDEDKLRVSFEQERGRIKKFVVQYYGLTRVRWRTIMRIDNCHGFPHRHIYHLHRRKEYRTLLDQDNNSAFTSSKVYVIKNFQTIRENYLFSH